MSTFKKLSVQQWARLCLDYRKGYAVSGLAHRFHLSINQVIAFARYWGIKRACKRPRQYRLPW